MARRKTSSFNLSFIDIISCGLGAVVLLLILIKDAPFFIEQELNESEIEVEDNSELLIFSTSSISESLKDDIRYEYKYWNPWNIKSR